MREKFKNKCKDLRDKLDCLYGLLNDLKRRIIIDDFLQEYNIKLINGGNSIEELPNI